ncbi:glucan phosphoethanolaminetransferase (alkaline phosphatase superfamily) [Alkalibacillus filiformis]|uniref:Glucan phosphoethanolaminetransferase (Alkaline phosphatase superfamily) n=1 Tax=Alkalibacillus filiformis TaxID=200990 RepID=A0ABU0DUG7_9BACI|nr:hypothetical protein [Alkalibacillus filiformis]MDQ0352102.1 glucan phosphoethanolaminetransferase (alkaline phosphatase superfamily) [Alkalibacillus filiformis]
MTAEIFSMLIIFLNISIVFFALHYNKERSFSMGMMVLIMVVTMTFGFVYGFLFGIVFDHNLLISTLISCGIAALTGLIMGVFTDGLAQLEGTFTGIMAAMMGAMLVVMLPLSEGLFILLIGLLLLTGTSLFMMTALIKKNNSRFKSKQELILLGVTCLSIVIIFFTFPHEKPIYEEEDKIHNHTSASV